MTAITRILAFKIALTVCVWCVPLLLFPSGWLRALGFPTPEPLIFLRLLGMAYTALVVGYAFGFRSARRGVYPAAAVWVGIISNGGAFLLLLLAALNRTWGQWGVPAQGVMWGSVLGTGAIAAALAWFGPRLQRIRDR
jgi:hypothetical protein